MFCDNCGTKLDKSEQFCNNCGTKQAVSETLGVGDKIKAGYDSLGNKLGSERKKYLPHMLGAAAIILILLIVLITRSGGNTVVGTWEDLTGTNRDRMMLNRDGTGALYRHNVNTGDTSSETPLTWTVEGNILTLTVIGIDMAHEFEITRQGGDQIIRTRRPGSERWTEMRRVSR